VTKKETFKKVALELIHVKGFKAMSMRDLAKALECDVSNIYNYTSSKSALLEDLLFDISNVFHDGIDQILESSMDNKSKISAVLDMHVKVTSDRPYEVALFNNEWRNLKPDSLKRYIELRELYEAKVQRMLEIGVRQGEFRVMNTSVVAGAILGTVRWIYSRYTDGSKSINVHDLHTELNNFVLMGVEIREA